MDEYVAYVLVVDGSAFDLDVKLNMTWHQSVQVGEVVGGEAAPIIKVTTAKETLYCYFLFNYKPETQKIHDCLQALQKIFQMRRC